MATVLGVEIGSDSLKIAVCSSGKVKKLIREKLPDNMVRDGRIVIPDAMSEFLKEIRTKYKLTAKNVKMVLPPQLVYTKTFSMPVMSDAELRLNLPYEFKDYIGEEAVNKTEYMYDYVVLNTTEADGEKPAELELFAASVNLPYVEELKAIFKKAGFRLICGMPREMALQNLVRGGGNVPNELAVVDIGHTKTSVDIFCNGVYSMGKTFEIGGQALDAVISAMNNVDEHSARIHKEINLDACQSSTNCDEVYNHIASEVIRIINFYGYSTHSDGLRDVYFCGGSSLIKNLKMKIMKGTELNPHGVVKFFVENEEDIENSVFCALAVGAGIQPNHEPKPQVKPEEEEEKPEEAKAQ